MYIYIYLYIYVICIFFNRHEYRLFQLGQVCTWPATTLAGLLLEDATWLFFGWQRGIFMKHIRKVGQDL